MSYLPNGRVKWIVLHYTASPIERATTFEDIERGHKARGFKSFGYHALFPRSGGRVNGRDLSKPTAFEVGAHSLGENSMSVGAAYEGGVSVRDVNRGFDTRTPGQIAEQIKWVDEMLLRFGGPGADGIDPLKGPVVIGHRDMPGAATQCPGYDVFPWWREVVRARNVPWWLRLIRRFIGEEKR